MFADWLQHPVTELVRKALDARRQGRKDDWETDNIPAATSDEWLLKNAANIGECKAYKFLCELDYDTLRGELEDE